ncbi:MAG: hypothetical protein HZB55_18105 [Deltaproteobacteria bacterium]|nr:hypothetical protein [Deltaproteobacteria bacterium]
MPQVGDVTGGPPAAVTAGAGTVPASAARAVSAADALGLRAGDLVAALVVEDLGGGAGIVDLQGKLFRAVYPDGLGAGARVTLRVEGTGPPLLLRVPEAGEEALLRVARPPATGLVQAVRGLLAAAEDPALGPELKTLLDGTELLRLPADPARLAPALARLIAKSGVFHEAALARGEVPGDVKSLALRLLSSPAEPAVTRLAEALLGHVEAYQARSVLEGAVVVPFVLPWAGESVPGEWIVDERSGAGDGGEAVAGALRVRLDLPRLGPVEVALRWGPAGNAVRLRLAGAGLDAVTGRLTELENALTEDAGVRLLELRAEPLSRAPAQSSPSLLEVLA